MRGDLTVGMWSNTLCMVWTFIRKKGMRINVDELTDFILNEVPRGTEFFGSRDEIIRDLQTMERLEMLKLEGNVIVLGYEKVEWLEDMAKAMEQDPVRKRAPKVDEFFRTVASVIQ